MYVIHLPSNDSAALPMRFQRPMSAKPSTFLAPGSAFAVPCGAAPPLCCWATTAVVDEMAIVTAIARRVERRQRMGTPATRGGCRVYGWERRNARRSQARRVALAGLRAVVLLPALLGAQSRQTGAPEDHL